MKLIENTEAREKIAARIMAAKNGKRRGHGSAFRTTSERAPWLAVGEKAVGIVGGKSNLAVYSPAGARSDCQFDRILFFGDAGVLEHEELATPNAIEWFDTAFSRAA